MGNIESGKTPWLAWVIVIGIIFWGHVIILTTSPISVESDYPEKDPTREVVYYNLTKKRWIYEDEIKLNQPEKSTPRAKGEITEQEIEEIVRKHLERKLKGYRKATYWGEEEVDIEDLDLD